MIQNMQLCNHSSNKDGDNLNKNASIVLKGSIPSREILLEIKEFTTRKER